MYRILPAALVAVLFIAAGIAGHLLGRVSA